LKLTGREKSKDKDGKGLVEIQMKLNVGGEKYKGKDAFKLVSDGELLKKITPLCGQVDSFMFDSKINDLFKFIINPLPKVNSEVKLHVNFESSTTVHLGAGVEDTYRRWYDRLRYSIEVNPSNGDLNEITDETAIYTPHKDFIGSDFIIVRIKIDDLSYSKMKIAIEVSNKTTSEGKEGDDEGVDYEKKSSLCFCCNRNNSTNAIVERRDSQNYDGSQSEDQDDDEYQNDDGSNHGEDRF
jgi:hypothetical protein